MSGKKGFQKGNKFGKMNKGKSHIAWNKGLTKETDERVRKHAEKISITEKQQYKNGRIPSKGFLGKTHSKEWKEKLKKNFISNNPTKQPEVIKKIKKARAKQILPVKDTSIEIKIQNFLKKLKINFITHQWLKIEHGYQCDIAIPSMDLIIECDGNYWHNYPKGTEIDKIRTYELTQFGYKVLRLWESDIKKITLIQFKQLLEDYNNV